jgi:diguanylate cyclase (GGDEF)-like protein/PAS domain S-box-containing protein
MPIGQSMNTARVLVIEDNPEIAEMLMAMLATEAISARSANSGQAGLTLARSESYDLILLDLGLPDLDGFEVCRRLRANRHLQQVPILMLTGRDSVADKVRAFELGATDYLAKTTPMTELTARVQAAIRQKRSIDREAAATQRQVERTAAELSRISKAVDSASDAVCIIDTGGKASYLNAAFEQLFGLTLEQMQTPGRQQTLFVLPEMWDRVCDTCLVGLSWNGEVEMRTPDGRHLAVLCRADGIFDDQSQLLGVVFLYTDITHRKRLERDLLYVATHDPLTGLANRRQFEDLLAEAADCTRQGAPACVLYLDLDHFKVVNEAAGHQAGDRLLVAVARLIESRSRAGDRVSRLGGDEFTVLMNQAGEADALAWARGLLDALDAFRFVESGRTFTSSASIGVAAIDPAVAVEELLARADSACHFAKARGRNGVEVFRADNRDLQRLVVESDWALRTRDALRDGRLELWLQPIVPLKDAGVPYYEALVRMRDPQGQLIPPGQFLPAAERFGRMLELDRFVLRETAALLAAHPAFRISANLSAKSLNDPALPDFIAGLIGAHAIAPGRFSFEITETDLIRNLDQARDLILRIQALGCHFALDDFGAGASSMIYLRDLPVDLLKIEGSFIRAVDTDGVSRALVKSMNDVGHAVGKRTVAEYVANAQILAAVRELGVDYAQGWFVSPPAPPSQFAGQGPLRLAC